MRSPFVLIATVLLSVSMAACGGATGDKSASSQPETTTVTTSDAKTSGSTQSQLSPQTDDYISTYGHEAAEPDKREIAALVNRYYAAAVAGDGALACTLIYSSLAKAVPEDYGRAPGGPPYMNGKTCATVLSKLFVHLQRTKAELGTTKVTGVRLIGDHGFAQLTSKPTPTGEIYVQREGSSWKLGVVMGEPCRRCAS